MNELKKISTILSNGTKVEVESFIANGRKGYKFDFIFDEAAVKTYV